MILPIVIYGDPVLRTRGAVVGEIDDGLRSLVVDMLETMVDANGVGLAAQQVGRALQVAVVDISGVEDRPSQMWVDGEEVRPEDHMPLILINPEIEPGRDKITGLEGCLSFPDITSDITRPDRVRVRTRLLDGGEFEFEASGLLSRAIQHENDHLQGILFIDRMSSAAKLSAAKKIKRLLG